MLFVKHFCYGYMLVLDIDFGDVSFCNVYDFGGVLLNIETVKIVYDDWLGEAYGCLEFSCLRIYGMVPRGRI